MKTLVRSALALAAFASLAGSAAADDKLSLVIPNVYGPQGLIVDSEALLPSGETHSAHFNGSFQTEFTQFNIALASQLTSVPIPSPGAGFTYHFDPTLGVFQRSTESFGPILADRADTVGRKKWSMGVSYQRYSFDTIESLDLDGVPAVYTHDDPGPGGRADVVTTQNGIKTSVDQFTLTGTYGFGDRVDLAVALPIVSADLEITSVATVQRIGTAGSPLTHFFRQPDGSAGNTRTFSNSGSASGIGDMVLRLKGQVVKKPKSGVALALDVRVPTGDEEDLLGAGALGLKPFLIASFTAGKFSPHVNVGYEWNGESVLAGDPKTGTKEDVPDDLVYIAGFDVAATPKLTLAADLRGRTTFDTPRLQSETFTALDGTTTFPNITFETKTLTTLEGALGVKANLVSRLLVNANLLFKLNDAGLRDEITPLFGLQYTF
jgi:hypothetical protein